MGAYKHPQSTNCCSSANATTVPSDNDHNEGGGRLELAASDNLDGDNGVGWEGVEVNSE